MPLAAGRFEFPLERRETFRIDIRLVRGFTKMTRQNVTVLEIAERDLRAPHHRCLPGGLAHPQFCGNLQGIPELLRREADRVQALRDVNRARPFDRPAQGVGSAREPSGKHAPPI